MRMNLTRPMPKVMCPTCDGYGDITGELQGRELMKCPTCDGTGQIYEEDLPPSDGFKSPIKAYEEDD